MNNQPDDSFLHLLRGVTFRPVFIIGDHRSGTTLLYKILADTGSFKVLTAYHVIHYNEILANYSAGREQQSREALAARFTALGLSNRIIDSMPVSPEAPEEYGFVLDDSRRPRVQPSNKDRMVEICRKLRATSDNDKPLLLKNPWDVLSFAYLKSCFPDARMIFLHRHPLGVINSQMRAIRSLVETRNEYTALLTKWYARMMQSPAELTWMRVVFAGQLPLWKKIVPRHVLRANRYYAENIETIPEGDRISLRYEDLCRDPRGSIEAILAFLQVAPETALPYEKLIAARDPVLLPEIARSRDEILKPFRPYLVAHGYEN